MLGLFSKCGPAGVIFFRQVLCWRTMWRQFMIMRLVEPTIFFYGVSLGFAKLIPEIAGHDYRSFLLPGSMAMGLMFGSLIDGSYGAYVRIFMQKTWPSFLSTPTRVRDIMTGEMVFAGLRSVLSATLLMIAGALLGAKVSWLGFVLAIPLIILLSMSLMAMGYVATSLVRSIDDFDFVWAFMLTPMMVFSGVMVDPKIFPEWLQWLTQLLPLTHGIAALRGLLLGGMGPVAVLGHMAALALTLAICVTLAHKLLSRRLVD